MRLRTRLQHLETNLRPPLDPPLRIILVDEDGRWWEREAEIDPESIAPDTRLVLLRYRQTQSQPCV